MKIPSDRPSFSLLATVLVCIIGCSPPSDAQKKALTEKVLKEVGVVPEVTLASKVKPEATEIQESIVKKEASKLPGNPSVQLSANSKTSVQAKPSLDDPSRPWISSEKLPRETWEVQYLGNVAVGTFYRKVDVTSTPGYFRHDAKSRMRVSLKGIPLEQRIEITTLERDNGELIGLDGFLEIGSKKQSFKGTVVQKEMRLTGDEDGQPFSASVEWKKEYRGPFAVDQSMHRNPLQTWETRLLKYFDPILRKVIDGRLEASDYFKTPTMLGGSRELLEVRNIGMICDSSSQALLWVDKQGEGFKSFVQANDILSFRTDPIVAQVLDSLADLRAMKSVSIPIDGTVDQLTNAPRDLASISFRVSHRSEDPYSLFTDRIGQRIRSLDARSTQVTVFRNGGESDLLLESDSASKKDDGTLAASEFIPANSAQVKKIANGLVSAAKANSVDSLSNTDKADACRREIQKRISLKGFDKQLGTTANSLRTRQANCIDHALLFASICRAVEIPTRVAIGVKFNRSKEMPAMNFHAWVEIRDGARWVPMDSTIEEFPMPLDRIKLRESKFNGANPYIDIISVYRLLPELEIKVMPQ